MEPVDSGSDRPAAARTRRIVLSAAAVVLLLLALCYLAFFRRSGPDRGGPESADASQSGNAPAAPPDEPEKPPEIREKPAADRPPFSGLRQPRGAAMDSRGRLWVADTANSLLRVFDGGGGFLGGWGGRGNGEHGFRELCGVGIRGDDLYVADTWNGRVQQYDLAGKFKATVSGLYGPRGVAVAPDGKVWVADTGNNCLRVYDASLRGGQTVGRKGAGSAEFAAPIGIAVAPSGTVYVADTDNGRVEVLDSSGRFLRAFPVAGLTGGMEPYVEVDDLHETVFVSIPGADAVQEYESSGAPGRRLTDDPEGLKFSRPTGLAIDRKNRQLYVVNSANNTISQVPLSPKEKGR